MKSRRRAWPRLGRISLIALAIASLVHAPLPQPDFHTIRHHDAPGQVCEKHDHLLRWHPNSGVASDVAVLHWHWFLPTTGGIETTQQSESGQALHAHLPDWQAEATDHSPQIVPDRHSTRLIAKLAAFSSAPLDLVTMTTLQGLASPPGDRFLPLAFSATFAPGASLTSLLHRWTC